MSVLSGYDKIAAGLALSAWRDHRKRKELRIFGPLHKLV
jgi:hypothetical protein